MNKKTIIMRRQGQSLVCYNDIEAEALEEFPKNCDLNVKITKARSLRQNNTYWGWLGWLISDGPEWIGNTHKTAQDLSDSLQLDLGWVRKIRVSGGKLHKVPESKSFEEMSQTRFNEYFNLVQAYMIETMGYDTLEYYLNRNNQ